MIQADAGATAVESRTCAHRIRTGDAAVFFCEQTVAGCLAAVCATVSASSPQPLAPLYKFTLCRRHRPRPPLLAHGPLIPPKRALDDSPRSIALLPTGTTVAPAACETAHTQPPQSPCLSSRPRS
jgi:hypothetical protein